METHDYADPTLSSPQTLGCVKDKKTMLAFVQKLVSLAPVPEVHLKLLYVEVPMGVRLGDEFADELIGWLCINQMYVQ